MGTIKTLLRMIPVLLLVSIAGTYAQENASASEEQEFQPVFITVTTTHWNDDPNADFSDWLKTEKEYFDKVTSKNDLIIGSGVYTHYFTADNSEVKLVSVYKSWDDIEKANEINDKLMKEGWPDEKEREAFIEKQRNYYSPQHSDEIYSSLPYYKPLQPNGDKPMIFYVKSSELSMNGNGDPKKFKEYSDKVTQKNDLIKGYYTHRHLWGSNSRELVEVFVFNSLSDMERAFEQDDNLVAENWADENDRKTFMGDLNKLFTGKHADYIYRNVPELEK